MGYEVKRFVQEPPDAIRCELCSDVCEDPFECPDEHLFCQMCLIKQIDAHGECSVDRRRLDMSHVKKASRNIWKLIENLQMRCQFYARGCDVVTIVEHIAKHTKECQFNYQPVDDVQKNADTYKTLSEKVEQMSFKYKAKDAVITSMVVKIDTIEQCNRQLSKLLAGTTKEISQQLTSIQQDIKDKEECLRRISMSHGEDKENSRRSGALHYLEAQVKILRQDISADLQRLDKVIEASRDVIAASPPESKSDAVAAAEPHNFSKRPDYEFYKAFQAKELARSIKDLPWEEYATGALDDQIEGLPHKICFCKKLSDDGDMVASTLKSLTLDDLGVEPPHPSDEYVRQVAQVLEQTKIASQSVQELMHVLDYYQFDSIEYDDYPQWDIICKQIDGVSKVLRRGIKVFMAGDDDYLVLAVAVLIGSTGSLTCFKGANFALKLQRVGFGNFLETRIKLVSSSRSELFKGHRKESRFDLVLASDATVIATKHWESLAKGGQVFNYESNDEIRMSEFKL